MSQHNRYKLNLTHDYTGKCKVISDFFKSKYFSGCKPFYIEGVVIENFNRFKSATIPMAQFHSRLSDKSDQNDSTTATHPLIVIIFLLSKGFID